MPTIFGFQSQPSRQDAGPSKPSNKTPPVSPSQSKAPSSTRTRTRTQSKPSSNDGGAKSFKSRSTKFAPPPHHVVDTSGPGMVFLPQELMLSPPTEDDVGSSHSFPGPRRRVKSGAEGPLSGNFTYPSGWTAVPKFHQRSPPLTIKEEKDVDGGGDVVIGPSETKGKETRRKSGFLNFRNLGAGDRELGEAWSSGPVTKLETKVSESSGTGTLVEVNGSRPVSVKGSIKEGCTTDGEDEDGEGVVPEEDEPKEGPSKEDQSKEMKRAKKKSGSEGMIFGSDEVGQRGSGKPCPRSSKKPPNPTPISTAKPPKTQRSRSDNGPLPNGGSKPLPNPAPSSYSTSDARYRRDVVAPNPTAGTPTRVRRADAFKNQEKKRSGPTTDPPQTPPTTATTQPVVKQPANVTPPQTRRTSSLSLLLVPQRRPLSGEGIVQLAGIDPSGLRFA